MDYVERVKAQANIHIWAKQMNNKNSQTLSFSYTTIKEGMSNFANTMLVNKSMYIPHAIETINSYTPQIEVNNNSTIFQDIKLSIISYNKVNQPIDPQLWNSSFHPIFIFEMNKYLEGNIKNISCSLLRIAIFIKQ